MTERRADYARGWTLTVALGAPSPIVIESRATTTMSGDEHEVFLAPAGVAPERADILSQSGWFAHLTGGGGDPLSGHGRGAAAV